MGHSYKGRDAEAIAKNRKSRAVDAGTSMPGSRNAWWMDKCKKHGMTSHQTPFGCEACQRERLTSQGLVKP